MAALCALWRCCAQSKTWILFLCAAHLALGWGNPLALRAAEKLEMPEFITRSWDSRDGLPGGPVQVVAQSSDGYWWLGTSNGLVRFDGVRFEEFNTNNTPALGDNRITSLLALQTGELWVGTEGGCLSRRQGETFAPIPLGVHAQGVSITTLAEDPHGGLWIGTKGSGLAHSRDGRCEWCPVEGLTNPADATVTQIVADRSGRSWAVVNETLATFENGAWKLAAGAAASGQRQVMCLAPAHDGGLWVATCSDEIGARGRRGTRIFKLDKSGWNEPMTCYRWTQKSGITRPAHLLEDREGCLWLVLAGGGIYSGMEGKTWRPVDKLTHGNYGIYGNCLTECREGIVCGRRNLVLVSKALSPSVTCLNLPQDVPFSEVQAVCACRDDSIWTGIMGQGGAFIYREGWRAEPGGGQKQTPKLPSWRVFFEDRQTNLWAGSRLGLYRLMGDELENVSMFHAPSISNALASPVWTIYEDRRTNLWVGTGAGIAQMGPDGEKLFRVDDYADRFAMQAIEEDASGQIWAAISGNGLYRKNGDHFEHYRVDGWSGEKAISGLHADAEGALWLTTYHNGLARLKEGKFSEWTIEDGLPAEKVLSVTGDGHGNLWFSSSTGIFGCPKSRLLAYQRGVSLPILFWHLTAADGLATPRCSGSGQPSVSRSPDGRLWFANSHGVTVLDPAQMMNAVSGHANPPLLEEILVDGVRQPPDTDGVLRVKSTTRAFEFHFTSPAFAAPEQLQFLYRLQGVDGKWVDAGKRRVAYYNHLLPGEYQFRLAVVNPRSGEWRELPQAMRVCVLPRIWERPMVKAGGALGLPILMATIVWSVGRARMRRRLALLEHQRALEQERSRIARDMHDEIGARLTQISLLSALAEGSSNDAAEVQTQTQKISSVARGLTRSLDEIVWAVRPQNDNLESLVDYLGDSVRDLCEDSAVRCWFSAPPAVPRIEVSASVRHNVLLACAEAVNNTLKHSGASEVRVTVHLEGRRLNIEITDNGRGFNVAEGEAKRSGLTHIRQRWGDIGGHCDCQSSAGEGTRHTFWVPLAGGTENAGES